MSVKDSGLPAAGALDGTEIVAASQIVSTVMTSVRTTIAAIFTYLRTTLGAWSKNQSVIPVALTDGASVAVDASLSNNFTWTLTGSHTLANPTNLTAGMVLNFTIDMDATGGWTPSFGSAYKFPGGTAPTWVTTASAKNFMSCYYDGTILRCSGGAGYA